MCEPHLCDPTRPHGSARVSRANPREQLPCLWARSDAAEEVAVNTAILAHVLQRARRENVGDGVQLLLRDEEVGGPMGRGRLRLGARAATMLRRIVHVG